MCNCVCITCFVTVKFRFNFAVKNGALLWDRQALLHWLLWDRQSLLHWWLWDIIALIVVRQSLLHWLLWDSHYCTDWCEVDSHYHTDCYEIVIIVLIAVRQTVIIALIAVRYTVIVALIAVFQLSSWIVWLSAVLERWENPASGVGRSSEGEGPETCNAWTALTVNIRLVTMLVLLVGISFVVVVLL